MTSEVFHNESTVLVSQVAIPGHHIDRAYIQRLPNEILSEIFALCVDIPPDMEHCQTSTFNYYHQEGFGFRIPISMKSPPLLFLLVCKRWSNVVLGTARLFTQLNLHTPRPTANPWSVVALWINHSRNLPLDICIRPDEWNLASPTQDNAEASKDCSLADNHPIRLIARNIHRIRTLRMTYSGWFGTLFPESLDLEAPVLIDLRLFDLHAVSHIPFPPVPAKLNAPKLLIYRNHAYASSFLYNRPTPVINIGNNIQYFLESNFERGPDEIIKILTDSPLLRDAFFRYGENTQNQPLINPDTAISLDDLRGLGLGIYSHSTYELFCAFLGTLRVPRLEILDIQATQEVYFRALPAVRNLVEVSSPPLRVLVLVFLTSSSQDLISLLRCLPLLEVLRLRHGEIDRGVIRALNRHFEPTLCPRLRLLDLLGCKVGEMDGGAKEILAMKRSREVKPSALGEETPEKNYGLKLELDQYLLRTMATLELYPRRSPQHFSNQFES